jgi:hypothetical protein
MLLLVLTFVAGYQSENVRLPAACTDCAPFQAGTYNVLEYSDCQWDNVTSIACSGSSDAVSIAVKALDIDPQPILRSVGCDVAVEVEVWCCEPFQE